MHQALRHQRFADTSLPGKEVRMRGARFQLAHQAMIDLAMASQGV
jgi:hypothetical protein